MKIELMHMLKDKQNINIDNLLSKPFSCYIINETSLGLVCAKELFKRGHKIYGIITRHQDTIRWAYENDIKVLSFLHRFSGKREYLDIFCQAAEWKGSISNMEKEKCR